MMMLNKIFVFHYQVNQNTGCNVKFVVNINIGGKEIIELSSSSSKWAAILLAPSLPLGYPTNDAELTFGELPRVYPGVRGC